MWIMHEEWVFGGGLYYKASAVVGILCGLYIEELMLRF